jgi:hypothetical protein
MIGTKSDSDSPFDASLLSLVITVVPLSSL